MPGSGHERRRLAPVLLGLILTALVVLSPAIYRTLAAFGSAGTLFEIAASERGCPSASPRDFNCYLISPGFAVWIVEAFDAPEATDDTNPYFPYAFVPLLHATVSESTPLGEYHDAELNARMLRLLEAYLEKGLSIERRMMGLTPLQYAVVVGQFEAAALLLEYGADTSALVDRQGRPSHGLNARQLAEFIQSREPDYDPRIVSLLGGETIQN